MKKVVIFGAGISGLTAAHELTKLGYQVEIFESLAEAGGFFRSARLKENHLTPSEYSWHGLGPWYHNTFEVMKEIPFKETSVFEESLSKPIDFGIAPDQNHANFYDKGLISSVPQMFQMTRWDWFKWAYLMLKVWCSNFRSERHYARLNASSEWENILSFKAARTWRACFGPWVGSDYSRVSLHHCAHFFRKQLLGNKTHHHFSQGGWNHQAGDNWLLLKGPSSEVWFNPWVRHLESQGVVFHFNHSLEKLNCKDHKITSALVNNKEIFADIFILGINPFMTKKILDLSPELLGDPELSKFKPLTQEGPHVQVSWRMSFTEHIKWPRERCALVLSDTSWNLTMFAQEQAWSSEIYLGEKVHSLWTGTACIAEIPGELYNKELRYCTKEEFVEEIKHQVFKCQSLNELIKQANAGKELKDFTILNVEVWHEWKFSPQGIEGLQPKWVNTTKTQAHQPNHQTTVSNLILAGAHCKTAVDVWSIEGAVESGKRAAQNVDEKVTISPQWKPWYLTFIHALDDLCFKAGLPHILDVTWSIIFLAGLFLL